MELGTALRVRVRGCWVGGNGVCGWYNVSGGKKKGIISWAGVRGEYWSSFPVRFRFGSLVSPIFGVGNFLGLYRHVCM